MAPAGAGLFLLLGLAPATACDELAGRLLRKALEPAIAHVGCGVVDRAGVDNPNHSLRSICYSSGGEVSTLEVTAHLECRTSDQAFFQVTVAEDVRMSAGVRGADCRLTDFHLNAGGVLGQALIGLLNPAGALRGQLQAELDRLCRP
ncbi:hypothetical protein KHC27_08680 [Ancylobacter lacus]|nr:hypothetical protein [Ancylobacter lacus]